MAIWHHDARLHGMLLDGMLQFVEVHSALRMGGDLQYFEFERGSALQDSEVGGALDRDYVARLRNCS